MKPFKKPPLENARDRKRKKNNKKKEDDGEGQDEGQDGLLKKENDKNCNLSVSNDYSEMTRQTVAMLDESLISYDLMDNLLGYIKPGFLQNIS